MDAGKVDKGNPAVGMLWTKENQVCTGTLIAPNVVLTAQHCTEATIDTFYTGEGTAVSSTIKPTTMIAHQVIDKKIFSATAFSVCPKAGPELALLRLQEPIRDIAPVPYATGSVPKTGKLCTAVGFGLHTPIAATSSITYEQKRMGDEQVVSSDANNILVKFKSTIADHGDSGGPLLCDGAIAAITSCQNDADDFPDHQQEFYSRVDTFAAQIASTIKSWQPKGEK